MQGSTPKRSHQVWWILLDASPVLLAIALYGYALTLPFFLDDSAHFDILGGADPLAYWGRFPTFPFYRPIAFTIWDVWEVIAGGHDPVALHFLNVACFGISGVLIGQVSRHLLPPDTPPFAAPLVGWLFLLFPFAYQAVAMVAALFHLTLVLGVTASLWFAIHWYKGTAGMWALFGCWVAAFVAVFSHETGVLIIPALIGVLAILATRNPLNWRRATTLVLPVGAIAFIYLLLWLEFRPQDATGLTGDFAAGNAVLLQGLVYPFARVLRIGVTGDAAPETVFLLAAILLVIVFALIFRKRDYAQSALFGAIWYLLAILPASLFLAAGYVLGQPRLALFAWIGGAMMWAAVVAALWTKGRFARWGALLLIAVMMAVSVEFLTMRRDNWLALREYQTQLEEVLLAEVKADSRLLIVNAPDFLTPVQVDRRFLLGTEGVLFADPAADYAAQLSVNVGAQDLPHIRTAAYLDILRSDGIGYAPHPPVLSREGIIDMVESNDHIVVTQFSGATFWPVYVGGIVPDEVGSAAIQASFDDNALYLLNAVALFSNETNRVSVRLRWMVQRPQPVKVFVHVYCANQFIAQSDGYPLGDTYPFSAWDAGTSRIDVREISLHEHTVTPECLRLLVGLYNENDGTRLDVFDPATGEFFEQDSFVVQVTTND